MFSTSLLSILPVFSVLIKNSWPLKSYNPVFSFGFVSRFTIIVLTVFKSLRYFFQRGQWFKWIILVDYIVVPLFVLLSLESPSTPSVVFTVSRLPFLSCLVCQWLICWLFTMFMFISLVFELDCRKSVILGTERVSLRIF